MPPRESTCPPQSLSEEVLHEIALFLPKRDLKSLLFVSNTLSRIARQLLFRTIDLHLTPIMQSGDADTTAGSADQDISTWRFQRSADILVRILGDAQFADQVRNFGVFAIPHANIAQNLAFQIGILLNAIPKLSNLRKVHCCGDTELVTRILQTVHLYHPHLQCLSIVVVNYDTDIQIPVFKHLAHFSINSDGDISSCSSMHPFLTETCDTLRSLSINNPRWCFPAEVISVHHLTQFEFQGCFSPEVQAFSEILANGYQLKSLMLGGTLECTPSASFRQYCTALPLLRHFSLRITAVRRHIIDHDLCPAISDFIRERTHLRTYHLLIPPMSGGLIGFDASAWGALQAMSELTSLMLTYPNDLPPTLAGWLVPRTVRALTLDLVHSVTQERTAFMNQLRIGMPPQLRYMRIMDKGDRLSASSIVERGFPNLRVVRINQKYWTVARFGEDGMVGVEEWPHLRARYYAAEWLESLGCVDAVWRGPGGMAVV